VIIPARHSTQRSRVLVAVLPFFVALALLYGAYFTDSGLGAGEKDVLVAVPALLWSVLFAAILWALTCRWPLTRALLPAAGLSLLLLVVLAYLFLWYAGRGSQHSHHPSSRGQPFSVLTRTAAASANASYPHLNAGLPSVELLRALPNYAFKRTAGRIHRVS
jgi:glucan phosphoethanolaminetransferase (alkaline phosphatase superfamily)